MIDNLNLKRKNGYYSVTLDRLTNNGNKLPAELFQLERVL